MLDRPRVSLTVRVLAIFLAWTLFGVYSGVQSHYRSSLFSRPYSWWSALYLEVSYTWIWAALTPAALWMAARFPFPSARWVRNSVVHLVAVFGFAIVSKLVWDVVARPPFGLLSSPLGLTGLMKSITGGLDAGTMLYCVVVLSYWANHYYREFQRGQLEASELHRQFTTARLQALKMQLHPHFLFNALHTISGLVHEDPAGADRMIARLSEFLRLSLEESSVQLVTLPDELRFLNLYLDIERVRFDERLSVRFDITEEAQEAIVPNLILQPLVENSIRYGISQRISGGLIVITARREDGRLLLSVTDNGPGTEQTPLGPPKEGVGLSNTRARLRQLYGDSQQLSLRRPSGGGLEVRILIPFETREVEARLLDKYARADR